MGLGFRVAFPRIPHGPFDGAPMVLNSGSLKFRVYWRVVVGSRFRRVEGLGLKV